MALDLEARLRVFFASAPQTIHAVGVIKIAHSAMSRTRCLWREPYAGEVVDENADSREVEPANLAWELAGSPSNLDQVYRIGISTVDIENEFRSELDAIPLDTTERIALTYLEYLSDDLEAPQAVARLQVESIAYVRGKALLTATSPRFNVLRTGALYSPRDFPMLRGFK